MQQAGQVPHLDQNDAHEQSLGQSDGSLPGPEQTLNHSLTHSVEGPQLSYDELAPLLTGFELKRCMICSLDRQAVSTLAGNLVLGPVKILLICILVRKPLHFCPPCRN